MIPLIHTKSIVIVGNGEIVISILSEVLKIRYKLNIFLIINSKIDFNVLTNESLDNKNIVEINTNFSNLLDLENVIKDIGVNDINILIFALDYFPDKIASNLGPSVFNINFFSVVSCVITFLKDIKKNDNNRIIILSSSDCVMDPPEVSSYHSAKWALESFSSSLQHELRKDGIQVDIINSAIKINGSDGISSTKNGFRNRKIAYKIQKLITSSLEDLQIKGQKLNIPKHQLYKKTLERVLPEIINMKFGQNPNFIRKSNYKKNKAFNRILITGGSSGLGRELAFLYANKSKEIIITGRNINNLIQVKNDIERTSKCKIITKQVNHDIIEETMDLLTNIKDVNLLINNAGEHLNSPVGQTNVSDYQRIFNINYFTPALLMKELIKTNELCKVINIISSTAICGRKNLAVYSSSKSALWALTRSYRRAYGGKIQFLEVLPSTFRSNLFRYNIIDNDHKSIQGFKIDSRDVAIKVMDAEVSGFDIVFIPWKVKLFMLLESLFYPLFEKMFMK